MVGIVALWAILRRLVGFLDLVVNILFFVFRTRGTLL